MGKYKYQVKIGFLLKGSARQNHCKANSALWSEKAVMLRKRCLDIPVTFLAL